MTLLTNRVLGFVVVSLICEAESICPRGRFGADCLGICRCLEGPEVCRSEDGSCRNGMCRPGWMSPPFCQSECPDSMFGMNCSSTCHCEANDTCNKINGLCSSGKCSDGWSGSACQTMLPIMSEPPMVISVTSSEVTLSWPTWYLAHMTHQAPIVIIDSYVVQKLSNASSTTISEWAAIGGVPANKLDTTFSPYTFTVGGLEPGAFYSFRLVIFWLSNGKVSSSPPGPPTEWIGVLCGAPDPPSNVMAFPVSNSPQDVVRISWTPVQPVRNQCAVDRYTVSTVCKPVCSADTVSVVHPVDHADVTLKRHTDVTSWVVVTVLADAESSLNETSSSTTFSFNVPSYIVQRSGKLGTAWANSSVFLQLFRLQFRTTDKLQFIRVVQTSIESVIPGATSINVTEIMKLDSLYARTGEPQDPSAVITNYDLVVSNLEAGSMYFLELAAYQSQGLVVTTFNAKFWTLLKPLTINLRPLTVTNVDSTTITLSADDFAVASFEDDHDIPGVTTDYYIIVDEMVGPQYSVFGDLVASGAANFQDIRALSHLEPILLTEGDGLNRPYYVAFHLNEWPPARELIIGKDRPLKPRTSYRIWFGKGVHHDGASHMVWSHLGATVHTADQPLSVGAIIAVVVASMLTTLLCLLLSLFCCIKFCRPRRNPCMIALDRLPAECIGAAPNPVAEYPQSSGFDSRETFDHSYYVMKSSRSSTVNGLRVNFENRLMPNAYYAMQAEFQRIPRGSTDTTHIADRPHHAAINRSSEALPYDKNRVRLRRTRLTDKIYVNASRIRTVVHRPVVIATQCPDENTVGEFWQMIWDENIGSIVMLVSFDKSLLTRYPGYCYWPKFKSEPVVYGRVEVANVSEQKYSYFERRLLKITGWIGDSINMRSVVHWQYIKWRPTGRLPRHPIQFVHFIQQVQQKHNQSSGMLVHCECGAGSSGVFLALDALSTEGRKTGLVDVEECVTLLCLERMNLVKTFLQYRFIYQCLLEVFLVHHNTNVPVNYFKFAYADITNRRDARTRRTIVEYEFSKLALTCYAFNKPSEEADCPAVRCHRSQSPIVFDGFLTRDLFILPSQEHFSCAERFWKLVYESKARVIVALCSLVNPEWLPREVGLDSKVGGYVIRYKKVRTNPTKCFYVLDLTVTPLDCRSSSMSLRYFEFVQWPTMMELPPPHFALDFVSRLAEWSRRDAARRPVVFCRDPGEDDSWLCRVALVTTVWNVLDCIHTDQMVDVFAEARYTWTYIPTAFKTYEEYLFVYKVINEHIQRVDTHRRPPAALIDESCAPAAGKPIVSPWHSRSKLCQSMDQDDVPCGDVELQYDELDAPHQKGTSPRRKEKQRAELSEGMKKTLYVPIRGRVSKKRCNNLNEVSCKKADAFLRKMDRCSSPSFTIPRTSSKRSQPDRQRRRSYPEVDSSSVDDSCSSIAYETVAFLGNSENAQRRPLKWLKFNHREKPRPIQCKENKMTDYEKEKDSTASAKSLKQHQIDDFFNKIESQNKTNGLTNYGKASSPGCSKQAKSGSRSRAGEQDLPKTSPPFPTRVAAARITGAAMTTKSERKQSVCDETEYLATLRSIFSSEDSPVSPKAPVKKPCIVDRHSNVNRDETGPVSPETSQTLNILKARIVFPTDTKRVPISANDEKSEHAVLAQEKESRQSGSKTAPKLVEQHQLDEFFHRKKLRNKTNGLVEDEQPSNSGCECNGGARPTDDQKTSVYLNQKQLQNQVDRLESDGKVLNYVKECHTVATSIQDRFFNGNEPQNIAHGLADERQTSNVENKCRAEISNKPDEARKDKKVTRRSKSSQNKPKVIRNSHLSLQAEASASEEQKCGSPPKVKSRHDSQSRKTTRKSHVKFHTQDELSGSTHHASSVARDIATSLKAPIQPVFYDSSAQQDTGMISDLTTTTGNEFTQQSHDRHSTLSGEKSKDQSKELSWYVSPQTKSPTSMETFEVGASSKQCCSETITTTQKKPETTEIRWTSDHAFVHKEIDDVKSPNASQHDSSVLINLSDQQTYSDVTPTSNPLNSPVSHQSESIPHSMKIPEPPKIRFLNENQGKQQAVELQILSPAQSSKDICSNGTSQEQSHGVSSACPRSKLPDQNNIDNLSTYTEIQYSIPHNFIQNDSSVLTKTCDEQINSDVKSASNLFDLHRAYHQNKPSFDSKKATRPAKLRFVTDTEVGAKNSTSYTINDHEVASCAQKDLGFINSQDIIGNFSAIEDVYGAKLSENRSPVHIFTISDAHHDQRATSTSQLTGVVDTGKCFTSEVSHAGAKNSNDQQPESRDIGIQRSDTNDAETAAPTTCSEFPDKCGKDESQLSLTKKQPTGVCDNQRTKEDDTDTPGLQTFLKIHCSQSVQTTRSSSLFVNKSGVQQEIDVPFPEVQAASSVQSEDDVCSEGTTNNEQRCHAESSSLGTAQSDQDSGRKRSHFCYSSSMMENPVGITKSSGGMHNWYANSSQDFTLSKLGARSNGSSFNPTKKRSDDASIPMSNMITEASWPARETVVYTRLKESNSTHAIHCSSDHSEVAVFSIEDFPDKPKMETVDESHNFLQDTSIGKKSQQISEKLLPLLLSLSRTKLNADSNQSSVSNICKKSPQEDSPRLKSRTSERELDEELVPWKPTGHSTMSINANPQLLTHDETRDSIENLIADIFK